GEKIHLRSYVYEPDIVIVLEPTLLEAVDVTKGLKKNGILIINSNLPPKKLGIKGNFDVHTIDATSSALEIFKRPIVNTPMIGAFCKVTEEISLKSMLKAIDEIFIARKGKEIAELNKKAVEMVYEETK
ncbi:2-oxoacid:acceptor oxidoreductase family protein, partial [Candidatus Woesearchaeota archaeon]|nr:2-oxoacid:acceptor oxidoreductase family protein [Candidatus Woesearchaeota archaeon]